MKTYSTKKVDIAEKLRKYTSECSKVIIVGCDNVGSRQFAEIRFSLRGKAQILMGKNTLFRAILNNELIPENPLLKNLLDVISDNVGLVFCYDDLISVKDILQSNVVPAPARQGSLSPCDVMVPAGPTGLGPENTSFFQALGISTKIFKSQIEILQNVQIVTEGEKVNASAASLLQKLDIKPFTYGLLCRDVYDNGEVYSASVLDITPEEIIGKFKLGLACCTALARETGTPIQSSVPHSIAGAFKMVAAIAVATGAPMKEADAFR